MQETRVPPLGGGVSKDAIGIIQRLAALNGADWSVVAILNDILPEQKSLYDAKSLFQHRHLKTKAAGNRNRKIAASAENLIEPIGMRAKSPTQFPAKARRDRLSTHNLPRNFNEHVLSIWEAKFRLKCLEADDILLLLAQPNIASTLETASFLREVHISFDHVMELEIALMVFRQQTGWNFARSSSSGSQRLSLCEMLARNAWMYSQAFRSANSTCKFLPEVIDPKRRSHGNGTRRALLKPAKAKTANTAVLNSDNCPGNIRDFVRDHCMEEFSCSTTMRKQFAAEKLFIIMSRRCNQALHQRFQRWHQQMLWRRCNEQVRRFCQLKCALWVLHRSRSRLERLVFCVWGRWMAVVKHEREDETFVAVVTIQSWIRGVRGRQATAVHHLHQAATLVQCCWRGFYCRKMVNRRKRYLRYNFAARQVQRFYHSYIFRVRCATFIRNQKAARRITRALKTYIKKRRDLAAWLHHLARYHAAIAIQLWSRRTVTRIRLKKLRQQQREKARRVLFNCFRRLQFLRCFGMRVDQTVKRRTAAAMLLQNAFRAKRARARFYELKVRLEDQRRQEILQFMWHNAYATTIQQWWRKRHKTWLKRQLP